MSYSTNQKFLEHLCRIIWNHKLLMAAVFLLVVISGMLATILITPKYEAGMSVIISRNRVDSQISSGEKTADAASSTISDEEFNSELELIRSGEVVAGVVKDLNLVNNQVPANNDRLAGVRQKLKVAVYGLFGKSAETDKIKQNDSVNEQLAGRVMSNLDVEPIKKSRIIKVTYTDTDPGRAKQILEKIYDKYVELHVRINEKSPAGEVFDEQSNTFEKKLDDATDALKRYDRSNGITAAETGGRDELLLQQVYAARSQADTSRNEINETEQRIRLLKEKIAAQPEQLQTGSTSKYVAALDRMKDDLVQLNQQKIQLLQKYKPNTRFVLDIEQRIQNLKREIDAETNSPPQEKSFALNDLRRRLESELANAEISLAALRTRERDLNAQAAQLRGEATVLNGKSIERTRLERERKINEEAYLLYQKKARENEVGQVLNRQKILNFDMVDAPRTDWEPKSPKLFLNLMVLTGLGAIAAFAAAILAEKLFPTEVEPVGLPVQRLKHTYQMRLVTDGSEDLPMDSDRAKSYPSKTALASRQAFATDPEDEKLLEISRFFNSKKIRR